MHHSFYLIDILNLSFCKKLKIILIIKLNVTTYIKLILILSTYLLINQSLKIIVASKI